MMIDHGRYFRLVLYGSTTAAVLVVYTSVSVFATTYETTPWYEFKFLNVEFLNFCIDIIGVHPQQAVGEGHGSSQACSQG